MTRDEILKMPAGYEMNKLIATNVMGWALVNNHGEAGGKFWIGHGGSFGDMPERYLPDFSGEIAPAFSVVEKLQESGLGFSISDYSPSKGWCAEFYGKQQNSKADGETAPLAICRAALLAVEAAQC